MTSSVHFGPQYGQHLGFFEQILKQSMPLT